MIQELHLMKNEKRSLHNGSCTSVTDFHSHDIISLCRLPTFSPLTICWKL
ncbi:hypothetical protein HanPSC8_Chr09g0356681 [Helianthus annuus]|nr:hypothetical protein HanPSC8_Chr09g0356681 [Helianthus annuus]